MKSKSLILLILLMLVSCGKSSPEPVLGNSLIDPVDTVNPGVPTEVKCDIKLDEQELMIDSMMKGYAMTQECQLSFTEMQQYLN